MDWHFVSLYLFRVVLHNSHNVNLFITLSCLDTHFSCSPYDFLVFNSILTQRDMFIIYAYLL